MTDEIWYRSLKTTTNTAVRFTPAAEADHREALVINDIMSHITGDPVLEGYFTGKGNSLAQFVIDYIKSGA